MVFIFNVLTKESAREAFLNSFEMMKTVPGFQGIKLYQNQDDKHKFTCVEHWDTRESHSQHIEEITPEISETWLSLLAGKPEILGFFDDVKSIGIV
ncbi:MAG: hypothetical protein COV52_03905 [Gammaproteobacteria bacterium CG11_big_fil_rev_8_21_14_0_20_46_22]|nr:MAG: hypothetical protein COW05_01955 [Gammaproteobacteria bacterium CG12_big_fil_rev_8_21_14_0_65_46_12]PIR11465.1 MAG: hypothetical protein COV52_03905 [Gammaproteobacteria bacterium CG11_big_fil_rev_8_21_14_0_20_46_22]